MRLRHYIKGRNKPEFTDALDDLGVRYKSSVIGNPGELGHAVYFHLFIYDDNPKWPVIRALTEQHDVRVITGPEYRSEDIQSAPWLFANAVGNADYPQPERNFGYQSATFDLTHYCQKCGIGKVQRGPFRLKSEPKAKSIHFFAPQWEHHVIFARHEIVNVFKAEAVSGLIYIPPVKNKCGMQLESITQLVPTTTLPDGLVAVVQEQVTCRPFNEELRELKAKWKSRESSPNGYCGRIKYHVPSGRRFAHYSLEAFRGAPDFVLSSEWFGSGAAASQQIIVSNRIANLILEHKWKGIRLDPIHFT